MKRVRTQIKPQDIEEENEALKKRVQELAAKAATDYWLDCHTTGERGTNSCGFEGTHVCAVCQLAEEQRHVKELRDILIGVKGLLALVTITPSIARQWNNMTSRISRYFERRP
jgi:hypothetical protein